MIQNWLNQVLGGTDASQHAADPAQRVQLACAVLLVEVARADWEDDARERSSILAALQQNFSLGADAAQTLLEEAEEAHDREASLHEFLRTITENWGRDERRKLLQQLWQVAFADGTLAAYEEFTIRRLADLLYVPHRDFIRAKLDEAPDTSD